MEKKMTKVINVMNNPYGTRLNQYIYDCLKYTDGGYNTDNHISILQETLGNLLELLANKKIITPEEAIGVVIGGYKAQNVKTEEVELEEGM